MSESKNLFSFLDMPDQKPAVRFVARLMVFLIIVFFFLVSLDMMGSGFKSFGKKTASDLINVTSNPFVSLFIGMLATAIIQSSSTTTTMIVGMAASGVISMEGAVPLIMGANIGTSVTSSIVSFGHLGKKEEYRKAIAAATVHDFFNILVTIVLFPLEYFFGILSKSSLAVAEWFGTPTEEKVEVFNIMKVTVEPVADALAGLFSNGWIVVGIAILLLFFMLRFLTLFLKSRVIGAAESSVQKVLFKSPFRSMIWGVGVTTAVQSSSVTTSLMVPLVASGKVTIKQAFPFMMGANIGTTTTALIAAFGGEPAGIPIALTHLFFNLIGVCIFFPIKPFREIPIKLAIALGKATLKNRLVGIFYIAFTFFITPFLLIFFTKGENKIAPFSFKVTNVESNEVSYKRVLRNKENNALEIYDDLKADSIPDGIEPDSLILIKATKKRLTMGEMVYPIGGKDECLPNKGKMSNCLVKVHENKKFGGGAKEYTSEKCYEFKQVYSDSSYKTIFVDKKLKMIFGVEHYSKEGQLLEKEELIRMPVLEN